MTTVTYPTAVSARVQTPVQTLGLGRLILLHLLPGLAIVTASGVIGWLLRPLDWPSLLALLLAIPVALLPMELGYLLYQGKRQHGHFTLRGVIAYNCSLSFKEYAIWVPIVLSSALALFILFGITDSILMQRVFFWWPAWMNPDYGSLIGQPPLIFWITVSLLMLFGNWVGPIVEELYFRGYLLPRMEYLGRWGVVLNGLFFAVYHFWSPWAIISRSIGILPIGFFARYRRNVMVPIIVHCMLNTVGTILALSVIL